jgi:AraC-like DNA-binding protein
MLVLTAWEGCRGLSNAKGPQRWQRVLFLSSYCSALLVCSVLANLFGTSESSNDEFRAVLAAVCAIQIILVTQVLIYWRFHAKTKITHTNTELESHKPTLSQNPKPSNPPAQASSIKGDSTQFDNQADLALAQKIQHLLEQQDIYLQTNLKVADLARAMKVSEYRISRVMRMHFKARNFNQLINEMRIVHAKTLLEDPHNTHWPIVVVGMESGFASVGPFTRAFKEICGVTPNQYRQNVR